MDTYGRNRFTEIDNQLASIREQISYIINLLKQNGFKDYEKEAAYKANLALPTIIVNRAERKVLSLKGGDVQIRINDVKASMQDVLALRPRQDR